MVASILAGYNINWARLIAEQIHESALRRTTCMSFQILIYKLFLESEMQIYHLDQLVEALDTLDPSLIKADENLVELLRT